MLPPRFLLNASTRPYSILNANNTTQTTFVPEIMFQFWLLLTFISLLWAGKMAQQTNTGFGSFKDPQESKVGDAGFSIFCEFHQDLAFPIVS